MAANLIYGIDNGRIYKSTNSGSTWTEIYPRGSTSGYWVEGNLSDDGTKIFVAAETQGVYYYNGSSWSTKKPGGVGAGVWRGAFINSDGTKLLASIASTSTNGHVWRSTDSGANWTELQPRGSSVNHNYFRPQMSDNGTYILLGEGGGRLWYSSNGGTSFTEQKPAGDADKNWADYIVSDDGQILFACIPGGRFYRSENAGSNWSEVQPAGNVNAGWVCIDASSDCNYVWAGCNGGRLYKSTDGGDSWSEVRPAGSNANKDWRNLTVSRDGSKVIVTN